MRNTLFQLAVKLSPTKLTMRPGEFLFRTKIDCTDVDIQLGDQLECWLDIGWLSMINWNLKAELYRVYYMTFSIINSLEAEIKKKLHTRYLALYLNKKPTVKYALNVSCNLTNIDFETALIISWCTDMFWYTEDKNCVR